MTGPERRATGRADDADLLAGGRGDRHLVVCGDDNLTLRMVQELVERHRARVTVIVPSVRSGSAQKIAAIRNLRVIESATLDANAFGAARLEQADTLAIVHQDDVGNLHAALQAQEIAPEVRLLLRMRNAALGRSVAGFFREFLVLSDEAMAGPAFVAAALGEPAPAHVQFGGRTLYLARRAEVPASQVVCGIAVDGPDRAVELLPGAEANADVVLAAAESGDDDPTPARPVPSTARSGGARRRMPRLRIPGLRRWHLATGLVFVGLFLASAAILADTQAVSLGRAVGLAVRVALGNGDLAGGGALAGIAQAVLIMIGIALVPLLTGAVVEFAVNRRLSLALGQLSRPVSDHVIVIGLGRLGTRIALQLHDLGVPVVTVDRNDGAFGAQLCRERGIPMVVGDATRRATLRNASVETCRALVTVSNDDVVNLNAVLESRALHPSARVVVRVFDSDFASRLRATFGVDAALSGSLIAAPTFAATAMSSTVLGTLPVGREAILMVEVPIGAGSALDGALVSAANEAGKTRVVALRPVQISGQKLLWQPVPRRLVEGDTLIALCTREGLGMLLPRALALSTPR